ncbi:MAG: glycosyltransferase family 2 protein [Gemmataceae bacterium]
MSTPRTNRRDETLHSQERPRKRAVNWQPAWLQSFADDGPIDVTVCIANWNCRELLRACLESLHDQPQGVRLETVVVDNGSSDGAPEMIARDFPEVVLIRNATNAGFSAANNQAAARARGRYLFFLNNDTAVPAGAIRKLVQFADAHPEYGMIGPRLRDPSGASQISYRRQPTVAALLHRTSLLRWTGLLKRAYGRYRRRDFDPEVCRPVETLMGAAVLLPRDVFFGCGGWDEGFTFGGEDIDLSLRVSRVKPVVYFPGTEVTHHGRVSSRLNVSFAEPNTIIGYVRMLRKSGAPRVGLVLYKLVVSVDAPLSWLTKATQYGWRRLTGRPDRAEKSRLAMAGLGTFLTSGLGRFWRA